MRNLALVECSHVNNLVVFARVTEHDRYHILLWILQSPIDDLMVPEGMCDVGLVSNLRAKAAQAEADFPCDFAMSSTLLMLQMCPAPPSSMMQQLILGTKV